MLVGVARPGRGPEPRRRRVVCVVGGDTAHRAQLAADLGAIADDVHKTLALAEVPVAVTRDSAAVVLLVDSGHDEGVSASVLKAFRVKDSACTVMLVTTDRRSRTAHQLSALARAGLDAYYDLAEVDSLDRLRKAVSRHLANAISSSVVQAVVPNVASEAGRIQALCIRCGHRPHDVAEIAHWLRWDRRTLNRKLVKARSRRVHDQLNIGLLLHAATLLDDSEVSIDGIARRLQFANPSRIRRIVKRETGCTPTELRERGAVKTVMSCLRAAQRRR